MTAVIYGAHKVPVKVGAAVVGVRYHMLMEIPVTRGEGVPGDNGGARQHDGRRDEIAGGQGLLQQHQRQKRPHEGWSPDCPSKDICRLI